MKTSAKARNVMFVFAVYLSAIVLGLLLKWRFPVELLLVLTLCFLSFLPIAYVRWRWWYRRKEPFWECWLNMLPYRPQHVIAREIELGEYQSGKPIRKELYIPIRNRINSSCRLCGAYMPKGTRIYWAPSLRMALCQKCFERTDSISR